MPDMIKYQYLVSWDMGIDVDWATEPAPNLSQWGSYATAHEEFEWRIPDTYNVGADVLSHEDGTDRTALIHRSRRVR